ncbi:g1138 [Coccomyxa elongata]
MVYMVAISADLWMEAIKGTGSARNTAMLDVSRLHSQFGTTTSSHRADCSSDPLSRKSTLPRQWHTLGNGIHPTRRGSRGQQRLVILSRQATEDNIDATSVWSSTVKGALQRWTTSGKPASSSTSGSSHRKKRESSGRSSTAASRKTVKQKGVVGPARTVKQTSGEIRGGKQGERKGGRFYWNITGFPFPLGPLLTRKTIRYEVERGSMWMFEQEQALGFSNVTTNVRMTVIKLRSGGLWVHAPVAPTQECVRLVKELGLPVEHIVLPTFAVEHKLFVGPFSRAFPSAQVHVAPRQWSWPLWLPVQFFGIFPSSILRDNDTTTPWADELEQKIFSSAVGIGPFLEVAFFHKRTRTLLTTDSVIFVPQAPPEVVREANLMEAGGLLPASVRALSGGDSEDAPKEVIPNNRAEQLQLGWQRMALQILYFVPYNLLQPAASFAAVSGKLLVSPVLKKLVFLNSRDETRRWVEDITSCWDFRRIIPAHFAAPVQATPQDFRAAFAFVYTEAEAGQPRRSGFLGQLFGVVGRPRAVTEFPADDMRALDGLERILRQAGVLNK